MADSSVQPAWETLYTRINIQRISVDERTMSSIDMIKELTLMNLNAQNTKNITDGTGLHFQKLSNLCVYFATMSAVRHEMKKIFGNLTSFDVDSIIPAGKSINELFKEKEFQFNDGYEIHKISNPLIFEIMLSVLLGCVSPRALSGLVKTNNLNDIIFYIINII